MLHCFMVYLGSYFIVPVLWHVPGFAWCVLFLRDITFTFHKRTNNTRVEKARFARSSFWNKLILVLGVAVPQNNNIKV